MPTGPLSLIGLAAVGALVMATLIGQRLGRKGLAKVFSVVAIGLTAYSTNQIHSMRLAAQPFPDAQEVTEVTWRMIHGQGYTITLHGTGPRPPRYAPRISAYAAFNHVTYGGPFTTGYHLWVPLKNFSLDYVTTELMKEGPCITPDALQGWIVKLIDRRPSSGWSPGGPQNDFPNYILYPAVLSGVFWVFTPPFLSLLGLWSYWRDRNRPEGGSPWSYAESPFRSSAATFTRERDSWPRQRARCWQGRSRGLPGGWREISQFRLGTSRLFITRHRDRAESAEELRLTRDVWLAGWKVEQVDPHVLTQKVSGTVY